jgi:hypothetical protein
MMCIACLTDLTPPDSIFSCYRFHRLAGYTLMYRGCHGSSKRGPGEKRPNIATTIQAET